MYNMYICVYIYIYTYNPVTAAAGAEGTSKKVGFLVCDYVYVELNFISLSHYLSCIHTNPRQRPPQKAKVIRLKILHTQTEPHRQRPIQRVINADRN